MSSTGDDADISASKIQPLASDQKKGVQQDASAGGSAGTDEAIDQARIDPVGGRGQYQNPEPRADDQGVVGRDGTIQSSKIDPLTSDFQAENTKPTSGLNYEEVDGARIEPLGQVRDEVPRQ